MCPPAQVLPRWGGKDVVFTGCSGAADQAGRPLRKGCDRLRRSEHGEGRVCCAARARARGAPIGRAEPSARACRKVAVVVVVARMRTRTRPVGSLII